jgi:autotransporter-associated beta strand protein
MAGGASAWGADIYWSTSSGGLWSGTGNWVGGIVATGSANTAVFPSSSSETITVDQNSDIGALRFLSGSQFTLSGVGILSNSVVDVASAGQTILIAVPVAAPSEFLKYGLGTAEIPSLAVNGSDVKVCNGTLKTRTLTASAVPGGVALGDSTTPANGTVQFLLTTSGDYVENGFDFRGYGHNFMRIVGGANSNGAVYLNWIHAEFTLAGEELFFTAAAGGEVAIKNVDKNSPSPLVKIGPGSLKIWEVGASDANRSYSGGTLVRNGTLVLGEDDFGTTTNGFVLANGRTSNGAGGSLGYNDFANPVQLGDSRFVVTGSGYDIAWDNDEFHCVVGTLTNDGQIVARLMSLQQTSDWAKGGLMMRETLTGNSKTAMMLMTPANGAQFQWRDTTGGMTTNASVAGTIPMWVKLARVGDVISGYISSNGLTWAEAGSATVSMNPVIYVGLAVSAHDRTQLSKAVFESVSGLPVGWVSQDVGTGFLAGSTEFTGTLPSDDIGLLAANTRWIGHALQVNPLGHSVRIGGSDAGSCTFAGPLILNAPANLVAPAGGSVVLSGSISGSGGITSTVGGLLHLSGSNTYSGATVVSNGQLVVESSAALSPNTAIVVADGATATISATLAGNSSLVKGGPGVMTVSAPQSYTGSTVVSGGVLRLGVHGLYEGRLDGNPINTTDPNPKSSIQMTTRYANSTNTAPWVDNSTFVYSGLINNPRSNSVVYAFAENFDDNVMLRIDGATILFDPTWSNQTVNSVLLTPGWHSFDLRLGQGSYGVGPYNGGVAGTTGLGVAYSNQFTGGWAAITDNTGNFLDAGAPVASFLSPSTTVSIASGAMLDLNRSTQTVVGVSGTGIVSNGQLVVTGSITPGATNEIGALSIQGNLVVGPNVVYNWDFNGSTCDEVEVGGTLTLPSVATLNLNGLGGVTRGQRMVLFTFGSYSGPMDLRGWSVGPGVSLKVDLANKQVVLQALGTLLLIN